MDGLRLRGGVSVRVVNVVGETVTLEIRVDNESHEPLYIFRPREVAVGETMHVEGVDVEIPITVERCP